MKILAISIGIIVLVSAVLYFLPVLLLVTSQDIDYAETVSVHIKERLPKAGDNNYIFVTKIECFPVAFRRIRLTFYVKQSDREALHKLKRWAEQEARESIGNERKVIVKICYS